MFSKIAAPAALLFSLVSLAQASCLHATHYLPRRATADGVAVPAWGYTGLKGPLNWAGIAAENEICASGKNQSPINVDSTIKTTTTKPVFDYPTIESAEFENLGTTIEVIANGTVTLGSSDFSLSQFHFHSPSEHRVNEEYYPLEMHMVHTQNNGTGISVLTILFELSDKESTPVLKSLASSINKITEAGSVTTTGALDLSSILTALTTDELYSYSGSLTTPPCSEGVTFYIAKTPLPIDVATFNAFKKVIKFNSRFSQGGPGNTNLIAVAAAGGQPLPNVVSSTSAAAATSTSC